MRVLLTTDTVGGVWDFSATLARFLEREGHSLLLAVIGTPSADQVEQLPEGIAMECRPDKLEWLLASRADLLSTAQWLERLARVWNAGVVHLNQMAYPAFARFASPTLVTVHSDALSWFGEVLHAPPPPQWSVYASSVRAGLHAATAVVAPSRYQADLVRRHYGRETDRVIYNGVESRFDAPGDRAGFRVISVGRAWDEAKGMAVLDQAISILGPRVPEAHLFGSLDGPNDTHFAPSALVCHGRVPSEEVSRWMSLASIYVAPSLYEPFGLAPLEAALRGCALVLSDIGSFRELWDGSAEFFPSGGSAGLAGVLEELMSRPDRVAELARAAWHRAYAAFGAERFAAEYLGLYHDLVRASETNPLFPREAPPNRQAIG